MAHKYTIEFDEDTWHDLVDHAGRGNIKDYITHLLEREFRAARTRAVVLCGGESAELYPTRIPIPKAMLPVNYRPVVEYLLRHLVYHGISHVTMVAGAKGNVRPYFGGLETPGIEIDIVTESKPQGTAGALRSVRNQVRGDFMVLNGDILTNVDLSALLDAHRATGAKATMLLTHPLQARDHDPRRLGRVTVDHDGRVVSLVEPEDGGPGPGPGPDTDTDTDDVPAVDLPERTHYNAGVYVFDPRVMEMVPDDGIASLEEDILPRLIEDRAVRGFVMHESDYWIDVADPKGFARAWEDMLSGRFPTQ